MAIEINIILVLLAASGLAAYLISILFIYEFLKRRNDKTPGILTVIFHSRKYARKYRSVSRGERRKSGGLYYVLFFSLNLTVISLLIFLLINILVI